jgi:hypothetical protein
VTASHREVTLRALYQAFNDRDIDRVLAAMTPDVDWPNGWEGGRLVGHAEVRSYWERQWAEIRPTLRVTKFQDNADGTAKVRVRQVFRDPGGAVLERSDVSHLYEFAGDRIRRMSVQQ